VLRTAIDTSRALRLGELRRTVRAFSHPTEYHWQICAASAARLIQGQGNFSVVVLEAPWTCLRLDSRRRVTIVGAIAPASPAQWNQAICNGALRLELCTGMRAAHGRTDPLVQNPYLASCSIRNGHQKHPFEDRADGIGCNVLPLKKGLWLAMPLPPSSNRRVKISIEWRGAGSSCSSKWWRVGRKLFSKRTAQRQGRRTDASSHFQQRLLHLGQEIANTVAKAQPNAAPNGR